MIPLFWRYGWRFSERGKKWGKINNKIKKKRANIILFIDKENKSFYRLTITSQLQTYFPDLDVNGIQKPFLDLQVGIQKLCTYTENFGLQAESNVDLKNDKMTGTKIEIWRNGYEYNLDKKEYSQMSKEAYFCSSPQLAYVRMDFPRLLTSKRRDAEKW